MTRLDPSNTGLPQPAGMARRPGRAQAARGLAFTLTPVSLAVCLLVAAPATLALPQGAVSTVGQASVRQVAPGEMQIVQTTPRAGLDWTSFSIAAGERVNVQQPAANAVLLNRVVGDDPSLIYGSLSSNGSVWLINPRGIVFGPNSRVDVGSLVASTLSITQGDLNSGRLQLGQGAGAGELRAEGSITATDGTVALVGPQLSQSGRIEARRVGLAAAGEVLVDVEGDGLVFFNVRSDGLPTRLAQSGNVLAVGGSVELRAAARAGLAETVLNVDGVVQARSLGLRGGRIVIDGGGEGITRIGGTLDATSTAAASTSGSQGGDVLVQGERILIDRQAVLDASGTAGGGQVRVGGDFQGLNPDVRHAGMVTVAPGARLAANALLQGDGGRVIVWSDQATRFAGQADAKGGPQGGDGGLVEVSSKGYLGFEGQSDRSAPQGRAGTLLLDPTDLTIQAGSPDLNDDGLPGDDLASGSINFADPGASSRITSGAVETQLGAGPVTLQATGTIFVNNAISSGSANLLRLSAGDNIAINQPISVGGGLRLSANDAGTPARSGSGSVSTSAALTAGGTLTLDNGGGSGVHGIGANLSAGGLSVTGGLQLVSDSTFTLTGAPVTLAADISGAGALTKSGSANLTLTGANTYTGSTTVAQGTLTVSSPVDSTVFNVNAGTLSLTATNLLPDSATATVAGGATLNVAAAERIQQLTLAGAITGAGTLTANTYALDGATVSANLGTGTLTSSGASTLNNTVGATSVTVTAGTLTLPVAERLANTATVTVQAGATLSLTGAGADETVADLHLAGTLAGAGTLIATDTTQLTGANVNAALDTDALEQLGGSSTLRAAVNVNTSTLVSAGTLTVGDGAAAGSLGTGTLSLSTGATLEFARDSLVTWDTNITGTGGTLRAAGSGGFVLDAVASAVDAVEVPAATFTLANGNSNRLNNSAAVSVTNSATFALGNRDETVGSLNLTGTLGGDNTSKLTASSGATLNATSVVNALLGGSSLTVLGNATLNNDASAGTVNVNAGTLTLGASGGLGSTANVTVATGAGLTLSSTQSVGAFTLAGTLSGGSNRLNVSGAATLQDGALVDAQIGSGTLDSSGAVAIHQVVTATTLNVNGGTLTLASADLLPGNAAINVASTATLLANGNDNVGALTLAGTLGGSGTLTASSLQANGSAATLLANLEIDGAGNATVGNGGRLTVGTGGAISFGSGEYRLGNGSELAFTRSGNFALGDVVGTSGGILTHGGSGTLTFNGAATDVATLRVNGGGTLAMQGTAPDLATLDLANNSSLVLGDGSGSRLRNAVNVSVANGSSLVTGNSPETVGSLSLGGTLSGASTLQAGTYTLQTGGLVNTPLGTGTLVVTGNSTLNGASAATVVNINSGTLTLTGGALDAAAELTVLNSGGLSLSNPQTVQTLTLGGTLSGGNLRLTVTGAASLQDGAVVNAEIGSSALASTGATAINQLVTATTLNVNSGTLTLGGANLLPAGVTLNVASAGALTTGGDQAFGDITLGGRLGGAGALSADSLQANGTAATVSGLLSLNGAGDATVADAGRLTVATGGGLSFGSGTFILGSGSELAYTRSGNFTLDAFTASGATPAIVTHGGNGTLTINSALTNVGTLRVNGGGTLDMSGSAPDLDTLAISGNSTFTLANGSPNRLRNEVEVSVAAGSSLVTGNQAETIGTLSLGGTLSGGSTLNADSVTLQAGGMVNVPLGSATLNVSGNSALNTAASADTVNLDAGTLTLGVGGTLNTNASLVMDQGAGLALWQDQSVRLASLGGTLAGSGLTLSASQGITLTQGAQINANLGAGTLEVTGAAQLAGYTAASAVNIRNGGTLSLATPGARMTATPALNVFTGGTLTMAGDEFVNSFTGNGTVNGTGNLNTLHTILNNSSVSVPLNTLTLTSDGVSAVLGDVVVASSAVVNSGELTVGNGAAGSLTLQPGGTLTVQAGATLAYQRDTPVTLGDVAGTGTLRQKGSSELHLAGTVSASTVRVDAGTLVLDTGSSNRVPDTSQIVVSTGGTLRLDDFAEAVDHLSLGGTLAPGGLLFTNTATLQAGGALNNMLVATSVDVTGAATIDAVLNTNIVQVGATGHLSVQTGSLLPSVDVGVAPSGRLSLSADQTVQTLALGGTLDGAGLLTAVGGVTLQLGGQTNTALAGGTLTVTGNATLVAPALMSTVNIDAGTLTLAGGNLLDDAANVTVAPSAGLALGSDETVGTLALAGTLSGTGHQLHTNGLTTLQAGALVSANLGAATVLVTGNSTLQGTASATTLLVSTGRLTLDGDGLLAGAPQVTVNSTGALALGGDETVGALTLAGTLDGTGTLTAPNVYFAGGRANANLGGGAISVTGGGTLAGTAAANTIVVNTGTFTLEGDARLPAASAVTVGALGTLQLGGDQMLGTLQGSGRVELGTHTLSTGLGGDAVYGGVIAGDGALLKDGPSIFTLSGPNTYSGATQVAQGTLALGASNALPHASAVQVDDGAFLQLGGAATVGSITLAGTVNGSGTLTAGNYALTGGTLASGAAFGPGTLTSSGNSELAGTAAASTVDVTAGTLLLTGSNRLSGNPTTNVASGATMQLTGSQAVNTLSLFGTLAGAGHTLTGNTVTLQAGAAIDANIAGGTLQVAGNATLTGTASSAIINVAGGNLLLASGSRLGTGSNVFVFTGRTLTLGGSEFVSGLTLSGTLAGSGHTLSANRTTLQSGANVLANLGPGTLTILGNSTLTGSSAAGIVNLEGGTLTLSSSERLSDLADLTLMSGTTLTLNGDETVASVSLAGTVNGTGSLRASEVTLNGAVVNANLGGGLLRAIGINLLNGQSAATEVDVISGTLTLGSAGRFTALPTVTVQDPASLRLGGAETFSALAGGGVVDLQSHTLTSVSTADTRFSGVMTGSGGLVKSGPGTFTLAGDNTYTGTTRIEGGTLAVSGTLLSGELLVNAGTLALGGSDRLSDTATVAVAGGADMTIAGDDTVATLALSGTLSGSGTLTARSYALDGGTANANLGSGTLTSVGQSLLNGSAAAGQVAVNGGRLLLASANRLIAAPAVSVRGGATLALGGDQTTGSLEGAGAVDLSSFTLSTGVLGDSTFSGTMGGTGGLVKLGGTTFTLGGSHSYSGTTRVMEGTLAVLGTLASGQVHVDGGTLALAANERLDNAAALSVASGALVTLAGDETVASLALAGTLGGSGTLSAATYALDGGTVNASLGAGSLQSVGDSTINGTLGSTTAVVNAGTLSLTSANRVADHTDIEVARDATLSLVGSDTVGSLLLKGTLSGSGTLSATHYTLDGGTVLANLGTGDLLSTGNSLLMGTAASDTVLVNGGALILAAADRLVGLPAVTVSAGAMLQMDAAQAIGSLAGAGHVALGSFALSTGTRGDSRFDGVLSGSGGLVKLGDSHFALGGLNSYTGSTMVEGGTLLLAGTLASRDVQVNQGNLALGAADRLADNADISVARGAALTLNGDDTVGSLMLSGTLAGNGTLTAATYVLDGATVDATLGAGALHTVGDTTLNGGSAADSVWVDAGTLTLGRENLFTALPFGPAVTVASGATLALGASQVIGSLAGNGRVQLNPFTLTTGALGSTDFAGVIAGSGGLAKAGSSRFTLSQDNTYTGLTSVLGGTLDVAGSLQSNELTVQAGTLALAAADRLADHAHVAVAPGAQLTLAGDDTINTLALAGTLAGSGTLSAGLVTLDGGTVLANLGGGTLSSVGNSTLGGTSAASTVAVQAGVLTLASGQRLSALPAVRLDTGATLQLAGDQTLGTLAGTGQLALAGFTATTGAGGDSRFDGVASGSGGLVKAGGSTFTLAGANSYNGPTRVEGGTLTVSGTLASGALDVAAGSLALTAPDRLQDGAAVQVQSGANFTLAGNDTIASLMLAGTLGGSGTLSAGSITLQGGQALLDLGGGSLVSRGASSLAGHSAADTVAVESGVLTLASGGRFTAAPGVDLASGAELLLGGDETLGTLAGAGAVALQGFTLGTGLGGDSSFGGVISGSGNLVKLGGSRFTLAGANTYTGSTRVESGTLALAAADRLADTSRLQVQSGGSFILAGDDTVASVDIAGTMGGSGRLSAATYTLAGGTVQADLGTGTLSSTGNSTLGGSANAGTVNVQGGSLALGAAHRLSDSAAVSVAADATLRLNGDDTVASLALAGTLAGNGTFSASTTALSSGTASANLGGGTLVSTGTSTLAGAAASTNVAVDSGTLTLAAAERFTAAPALTVASGATLQVVGDQTLGSLAGAGGVNLGAASLATGSAGDSLYAGQLAGSGGLVKRGDSTFTITGDNSYSGTTTVAQGTLRVGDGGSLGSLASSAFVLQGALAFDRSDSVTLAQPVSGTGTLVQAGTGTLTLAGHNKTYTGSTLVSRGVLATGERDELPDASAVEVQADGRLTLGGSEILRSITALGSVALGGDLTATEDLLLGGAVTVPGNQGLKLTARRIDATHPGNIWGQSLSLEATDSVTLASGTEGGGANAAARDLVLGTLRLAAGGRIDAGLLSLSDTTTLTGGTLALVSSAAQGITAPAAELTEKQAVGLPIAYAADAVVQTGGSIDLAAGAMLQVQAANGGSIKLLQADNRFLGGLQVLSGKAFGTAWEINPAPGDFGKPAPKGYALQGHVQVAGSTVVVGGQGIEADVISISADTLSTPTVNSVVPTITARLPFDNSLGTEVSLPALTLALSDRSFTLASPFGARDGEIRINVGSRLLGDRALPLNAGYVAVLPRGGAKGSTAVLLAGPAVGSGGGYRFFFEGAGVQGEIPVYYNGLLPVTPAVESSISATVSVSEGARKERFDEAVRTENVAVRLRAGVIAEVGPGRPATQGLEGARAPAACAPTAAALACAVAP